MSTRTSNRTCAICNKNANNCESIHTVMILELAESLEEFNKKHVEPGHYVCERCRKEPLAKTRRWARKPQ